MGGNRHFDEDETASLRIGLELERYLGLGYDSISTVEGNRRKSSSTVLLVVIFVLDLWHNKPVSTTGVTKAVVCAILSVGWCI